MMPHVSDSDFTKIKDHVSGQHKNLLSLKQQHELLDQEIQDRIMSLSEAQQKHIILEGDIQTYGIGTVKKEEMLSAEQTELRNSTQQTKVMSEATVAEKAKQRKYLQLYENKMKQIGQKLHSGPISYERKNIQADICTLCEEATAVAKDLHAIERDLNALQRKYGSMLRISSNFETNDTPSLYGLERMVKQMNNEEILYEDDICKFDEDLKNLAEKFNNL